jgi:autotransporter-associated beta strand protein
VASAAASAPANSLYQSPLAGLTPVAPTAVVTVPSQNETLDTLNLGADRRLGDVPANNPDRSFALGNKDISTGTSEATDTSVFTMRTDNTNRLVVPSGGPTNSTPNHSAIGTGTFAIDGGNVDKLGSGSLTLNGGDLLWAAQPPSAPTAAPVMDNGAVADASGAGTLVKAGAGTLTLAGTQTYTGTTSVQGGEVNFTSLNNFGNGAVTQNAGNDTFDANGNNVTFSTALSGNGVIVLTGSNTYAGGTTLSAGTLTVTTGGNVSDNVLISGGSLDFSTQAATTDRLFTLGNSTSTVGGVISGTGSVSQSPTTTFTDDGAGSNSAFKTGTGTWTLTGNSTYGGTVNTGAGSLTLNGVNTFNGTTTVNGGTLQLGSGSVFTLAAAPASSYKSITMQEEREAEEAAALADAKERMTQYKALLQSASANATAQTAIQPPAQVAAAAMPKLAADKENVTDNGALVFDGSTSGEPVTPVARPPSEVKFPPAIATADNAFSTFALNVNDASYRVALAALESRQWPDPAGTRTEEFLNAFQYHDPAPAPGEPCTVNYDMGQNPFESSGDLLRVSFQTAAAGRDRSTPLRLTILLDGSGSMTRADRVATLQAAMRTLGQQLRAGDTVSLVTFARTAQVRATNVPTERFGEILQIMDSLLPDGGTNMEDALKTAYQIARQNFTQGAQNRVILLTDGAANLGELEPPALAAIVEENRKAGIALDAYGVGWDGYNDAVLEALTRKSDGRYGFLNRPEDVDAAFARKLAGALTPAAQDVKLQIEFNPARVESYRLMGYNNLRLTQQQFRDNTVSAGELAAADQGTALYNLVLNPDGRGPIATVRARYRDPGTENYHELSWTVQYTGLPPAFDQAPPALRLAAVAGYFAEYLQQSPFAAEVKPHALGQLLRGVPEAFAPDPRPAGLAQAIAEASSLSGD